MPAPNYVPSTDAEVATALGRIEKTNRWVRRLAVAAFAVFTAFVVFVGAVLLSVLFSIADVQASNTQIAKKTNAQTSPDAQRKEALAVAGIEAEVERCVAAYIAYQADQIHHLPLPGIPAYCPPIPAPGQPASTATGPTPGARKATGVPKAAGSVSSLAARPGGPVAAAAAPAPTSAPPATAGPTPTPPPTTGPVPTPTPVPVPTTAAPAPTPATTPALLGGCLKVLGIPLCL